MIMPDGRSLAQWLHESEDKVRLAKEQRSSARQQRRKGRRENKEKGWFASGDSLHGPFEDGDDPEMNAIRCVGAKRRNRWLNERLLRDLAGPMDAEAMRSQFAPPPFGFEAQPTAIAAAQNAGYSELLLEIDMDESDALLAGLLQPARGPMPMDPGHMDLQKLGVLLWSGVTTRARKALRRAVRDASPSVLYLEQQLLSLLVSEDFEFVLKVPSSFQRLLMHGLCDFYRLHCFTTTDINDDRVMNIRRNASNGIPAITCTEFLKACFNE